MDYSQYYKEDNGMYSVHFPNKKGLSIEQIRDIFSKFGTVVTVNAAGDLYGRRFVRYRNIDEIIACLEGLKNHESVKIGIEKIKTNKRNPRVNIPRNPSTDSQMQQSFPGFGPDVFKSPIPEEKNHSKIFKMMSEEAIPSLVSTNQMNKSLSQSSLSSSNPNNDVSPRQKIISAAEVMVANIHRSYSIHYILHLFRRYDPISVSLMKNIRRTSLQYCHVYFKQPEQAMAIQTEFDKFQLSGNHLIVLTSDNLIEEAVSS